MPMRDFQSVLYVDDDPDICSVVQATLRLVPGLDVQTADSGERAIDLAYELRPDLVLMDVMMPGLDGPSTFRRMRECALLTKIPVIFMTAKSLAGGDRSAASIGRHRCHCQAIRSIKALRRVVFAVEQWRHGAAKLDRGRRTSRGAGTSRFVDSQFSSTRVGRCHQSREDD